MKLKIVFAQEICTTEQAMILVESQYFGILDLMPTFVSCTIVQGAAGATTWFVETPYVIQAAREVDATTAAVITIIDDKTTTMLKNFNTAVVPVFNKGINYLIPYSAGVVVNMIPPINCIPMQQSLALQTTQVGNTAAAMMYHYKPQENTNPLGGATPTCITFDSDDRALLDLAAKKQASAQGRLMANIS